MPTVQVMSASLAIERHCPPRIDWRARYPINVRQLAPPMIMVG
jgi:hypothetical protein